MSTLLNESVSMTWPMWNRPSVSTILPFVPHCLKACIICGVSSGSLPVPVAGSGVTVHVDPVTFNAACARAGRSPATSVKAFMIRSST